MLDVGAEPNNILDSHTVATFHGVNVVGHLPIEFSRIAWHFLQHEGRILCVVTGHRKYSMYLLKAMKCHAHWKTTSHQKN